MGAKMISIVVPSRDRNDRLRRLLLALNRQRVDATCRFEVLVALDGHPAEPLALDPGCLDYALTVLQLDQVGISAAKNAAVAQAAGEILLFLNDDVEPVPDFVARHAAAHQAGHQLVLGSAPWKQPGNPTVLDASIAATRMIFFYPAMTAGATYDFRHAWNLNLSIRRSALPGCSGPFAADLRPCMYEDLELAFRILGTRAGIYYEPLAAMVHDHRYDLAGYFVREAMLGVMAPVLWRVNPSCFQAVFHSTLDEAVGLAQRALPIDVVDAGRMFSRLMTWARESAGAPVDAFYAAHLPLKRRAFRLGLRASVTRSDIPWPQRPALARRCLVDDEVFGAWLAADEWHALPAIVQPSAAGPLACPAADAVV